MSEKGLASRGANPFFVLPLDDSGKHHVVLWANGCGVLVGAACEGDNVFSHVRERDDFINKAPFGTVNRP